MKVIPKTLEIWGGGGKDFYGMVSEYSRVHRSRL